MGSLKNAPRVLVILHDPDVNLNELAVPLAEEGVYLDTWDVREDYESKPPFEDLNKFSGIISLGSNDGVLDEHKHEWMQYERKIIEWALETETPVLGLCFGSQILASAAGGTYKKSPVPEMGWTRVEMNEAAAHDPVMSVLGSELDAFQFHFDSFNLPKSAVLMGETNGIVEAFKIGKAAWGTQFHIEVGLSQQLAWLTTYRRYVEEGGINVDDQIEQSYAKWREYQAKAHLLAQAFAQQVKKFAAEKS